MGCPALAAAVPESTCPSGPQLGNFPSNKAFKD